MYIYLPIVIFFIFILSSLILKIIEKINSIDILSTNGEAKLYTKNFSIIEIKRYRHLGYYQEKVIPLEAPLPDQNSFYTNNETIVVFVNRNKYYREKIFTCPYTKENMDKVKKIIDNYRNKKLLL